MCKLIVFVLFVVLHCRLATASSFKLIQANVLWRHGNRSPLFTYKTDLVKLEDWGVPYGHITPLGKNQAYTKGLILHQRYVDQYKLISKNYNASEAFFQSTNMSRSLLSGECVIGGIYSTAYNGSYPINKIQTLPSMVQKTPIHVENFTADYVMNVERRCPRADALAKARIDNVEFQKYFKTLAPLFTLVREQTGRALPDVASLRLVLDTLEIAKQSNKSLPPWATEDVLSQIQAMAIKSFDYTIGDAGFGLPLGTEMIALRGGPWLKEVLERMNASVHAESNIPLFKGYSGHDITITSIALNLGIKRSVIGTSLPDYTAALAIELWKDMSVLKSALSGILVGKTASSNKLYYVQVLYSKDPLSPLVPVKVPGCPADSNFCPFDTFLKRNLPFIPQDIVKQCG